MNRETTNKIRFVLEDILPAFIRDSRAFKGFASLIWGKHIADLARFRERAPFLSDAEYEALYKHHPRVHEGTDNSEKCLSRLAKDAIGTSICDIGCGTGYTLGHIRDARPDLGRFVGVDFAIDDANALSGIEYFAAKVENLPFEDNEFDTVICTHVIEHVLDYRAAIAELRRITKKRLIIIVPREREYRYTFNPHFNFFPYTHSFLRAMQPVPPTYQVEDIKRDIYYYEDMQNPAENIAELLDAAE